jgi:hypothetical protein
LYRKAVTDVKTTQMVCSTQNLAEPHLDLSGGSDHPSPVRILEMTWGFAPLLILKTALDYRVFDVLETGSKSMEQLRKETGASERGLRAIVNALVGLRFLRKDGVDCVSLTAESATFLVSSRPEFYGGIITRAIDRRLPRWLGISGAVRRGHVDCDPDGVQPATRPQ